MIVDQCLPDFGKYDAIGSHVLQVRRALREAGYESEIWADRIDDRIAREARPFSEFPDDRLGALIYQLSTDSTMLPWLAQRVQAGARLAANYHNITPSAFFRRWEPNIAARLDVARAQLAELATIVELGLAVSRFNEVELQQAGYAKTAVSPLLVDLGAIRKVAGGDRPTDRNREVGASWLFVGRLAPNKCQHDVVAALAIYRRLYDPIARLTLVGSPSSYRYQRAVERLATDLGVGEAVELVSGLNTRQLAAQYRAADVFVCLSEHEGFCVPLLEAMDLGLPVVAYDAGAISETLAGAGVLLQSKDPLEVAVTVQELLHDQPRQVANIKAGHTRAREFSLEYTSSQFIKAIATWVGEPAPTGQ